MAFNIQTFADNLATYGSMQTNKFEVRMRLPTFLLGTGGLSSSTLTFRADRVDMPGVLLDTVDTRRYGVGPIVKTPTNKSKFNEVTMSFVETQQGEIYTAFRNWLQGIVDFSGAPGTGIPTFLTEYKSEYCVDIQIKVFNNLGLNKDFPGTEIRPVLELNLVDAFPLSLGDTNLSWSNNNELFKTSVTFAYTYHQLLTGTNVS